MIKTFAVAILCSLLAGCTPVISTSPVGDEPVDATGLIGVWTLESDVYYVTDKDAAHGMLTLTEVILNRKTKQPEISVWPLHIHKSGDTLFASIETGGSKDREFPFALLKVDSQSKFESTKFAMLSLPNENAFARLVSSGILRGKVSKNQNGRLEKVWIERITAKDVAVLGQPSNRDVFTTTDSAMDTSIDSLIAVRRTDLRMREIQGN